MSWNRDKCIKWTIILALFLFGLYAYLVDHGYADEIHYEDEYIQYVDYSLEDPYLLPQHKGVGVPVEDEYLYQTCPNENQMDFDISCNHLLKRVAWGRGKGDLQAQQQEKRKRWQENYDFHMLEAKRTYTDAYERVWWLPNLTMRQLGRDAWIAACAATATKTPCTALVVAFSTMLSQYGLHCMDEWDYIENKLYWSGFHFNECSKYAQLLHL